MSTITIVNNTESGDPVRLAIFRSLVQMPTLDTIAWKIVAPPPSGGSVVITIPDGFDVYVNVPVTEADHSNPNGGNRSNIITFSELTARFLIQAVTAPATAVITQVYDGLVLNEVRIENDFASGVWSHVAQDGNDVYAPQVLWPGAVRMMDLRGPILLAVVSPSTQSGDRLIDEEISLTQVQILPGQTAIVAGSQWKGYSITIAST